MKLHRVGWAPGADAVAMPAGGSRRAWTFLWSMAVASFSVLQAQLFPTPLSAQSTAPTEGRTADSTAIVRPGDVIRLKVWREPDMSGDVTVNDAGVATLPRVGALQVSNLAADSLQRFLVNTYSKDLRDPAIDITVLRRITILGAVRNPNVYQVEPTMTVADALALAGGASPDGKQDVIELRREGSPKAVKLSRGVKLADTPVRSGDQLYVPERSWLSRNTGLVLGGIGTITSIVFLIARR